MSTPMIDTFIYTGQDPRAFPRWLWFRNWAQSSTDRRLVLPGFLRTLIVRPGETITLHADRSLSVGGISTDSFYYQN